MLQLLHHEVADDLARHLLVERLDALPLDAIGDRLDLLARDRALLAGAAHAVQDLLAVELLTLAGLLDDPQRRALRPLVGRVAPMTVGAHAPAANREPI